MKTIRLFPALELAHTWAIDRTRFSPDATKPPLCLRCGAQLHPHLPINATSRYANVHVCEACGMDEALRDMTGDPLPLAEWDVVVSGRLKCPKDDDAIVLNPFLLFSQVFHNTATDPDTGMDRPVSEYARARSYCSGDQWNTNWYTTRKEELDADRIGEMHAFHGALLRLPEFHSLDAMARMSRVYAQRTSSDSEYNLFSETASFYVWLRLITRPGDHNLYVYFYLKN